MSGSIQHHPEKDELVEYASGALSTAQALCVSIHLEFCSPCRRMVGRVERLGGALLEDLGEVAVEERALEQVWQRIQNAPLEIRPHTPTNRKEPVPRPLQALVPRGFSALRWRRLLPSVQYHRLTLNEPGRCATLLRIMPGGRIGEHNHLGMEWTVVLQGSFSDHAGLYLPGDYQRCEPGHVHLPVATRDRECICLTVHGGAIRFTG